MSAPTPNEETIAIVVHVEYLFHFRCGHCQQWWTIADLTPEVPSTVGCPACLRLNLVTSIESHLVHRGTVPPLFLFEEYRDDPRFDGWSWEDYCQAKLDAQGGKRWGWLKPDVLWTIALWSAIALLSALKYKFRHF